MTRYIPKGERHHSAKLTEVDVLAIRELRKRGVKLKDLALIYPVSLPQLSYIINKKRWGHVK